MIKVASRPEYASFDRDVRRPGAAFLATTPRPNNRQFRKHEYWSRSRTHLTNAYGRICAYTSFYLPTGATVDHFIPKSLCPLLAYEWDNFRLCMDRVNNWKKNSLVAVDPFYMDSNWVILALPECVVKVAPQVPAIVRSRLRQTIELLRLNKDESFVEYRYQLVSDYVRGITELEHLHLYFPFIGREVERQGGRASLLPLF